jgi:hypothetical protein
MDISNIKAQEPVLLSIFPNPAHTNITVDLRSNTKSEKFILEIINVSGTLIYQNPCYSNVKNTISVGNLSNGVYICIIRSITDLEPKAYKKFIVQH